MKSNKALMGVMAGAATGAVLGVLFAPHKGSSTRKRIMSMGGSYMSNVKQILEGYVSMMIKKM
ncbi:MAG: YtxH domain-containing protein [Saprospiraceae bacterium]|nr:YtxH domain-containing protein [Saprospiraceae bacterium]MBK9042947.1 YtxH domain-containing protein [Saprospiraceae bacterium]